MQQTQQADQENVFYTPKFSNRATISVRRLAWYMGKPMTKTINAVIQILPYMFNSTKVCNSCKDKTKCKYCAFNTPNLAHDEQFKILENL